MRAAQVVKLRERARSSWEARALFVSFARTLLLLAWALPLNLWFSWAVLAERPTGRPLLTRTRKRARSNHAPLRALVSTKLRLLRCRVFHPLCSVGAAVALELFCWWAPWHSVLMQGHKFLLKKACKVMNPLTIKSPNIGASTKSVCKQMFNFDTLNT